MTIEQKIRAIIKATGWKQQKVAEVFGVSQSTVNRWLRGSEPEGHRRDAIDVTYREVVDVEPATDEPISNINDVRKVLERIKGLKPHNIGVLLSMIEGFQQANAAQPSLARRDDQSEPATPHRESTPSR